VLPQRLFYLLFVLVLELAINADRTAVSIQSLHRLASILLLFLLTRYIPTDACMPPIKEPRQRSQYAGETERGESEQENVRGWGGRAPYADTVTCRQCFNLVQPRLVYEIVKIAEGASIHFKDSGERG
jgi:hypothetical protein